MKFRRVPQRDDELSGFIKMAIEHLEKRFREAIVVKVPAASTVNLLIALDLPVHTALTLENTAAPGAPDLYFCVGKDETAACNVATAVEVTVGTPEVFTLKEMGEGNGKHYMNVTNAHPTNDAECRVSFELNWKRLGLHQEQMSRLKELGQEWLANYLLSISPATRTTVVVSIKDRLRKQFTQHAQVLLNIIAASVNITQADRDILRLPARDRTKSARPRISDAPYTGLLSAGGCTVKLTNRVATKVGRASIHPHADGVEIRWIILDANAPAPASPAECPNSQIITKAIHILHFEPENAAKRLHLFTRWHNNSDPHKSGPWSNRQNIVIS